MMEWVILAETEGPSGFWSTLLLWFAVGSRAHGCFFLGITVFATFIVISISIFVIVPICHLLGQLHIGVNKSTVFKNSQVLKVFTPQPPMSWAVKRDSNGCAGVITFTFIIRELNVITGPCLDFVKGCKTKIWCLPVVMMEGFFKSICSILTIGSKGHISHRVFATFRGVASNALVIAWWEVCVNVFLKTLIFVRVLLVAARNNSFVSMVKKEVDTTICSQVLVVSTG